MVYTQRLKDTVLLTSTGSTGNSNNNAMAENINGLYQAEVIQRKIWKNRSELELPKMNYFSQNGF